jgi:hypothetical protein
MTRRRCIRLVVPADLHLVPSRRDHAHASELLMADWKLRGAWRHGITDATTPPNGASIVGAA